VLEIVTDQTTTTLEAEPRISTDARVRMLNAVPALAALPMEMRQALVGLMREERFAAGETVVKEGEAGDRFYLIVEGRAEVSTRQNGKPVNLATLEPGALFGELALIKKDHSRLATVTATTPLVTLTLGAREFEDLEVKYPEIRRIVESHSRIEHMSRYLRTHILYRCHFRDPRRELMFLSSLSFFIAFVAVRGIVTAIRNNVGPFHNVSAGGTHIHHLVWGILLLLIVGYMWLMQASIPIYQDRRWHRLTAILFGVGAALTLDEFALWLKLADVYFTPEGQKSIQAVIVFGSLLSIGVWGGRFLRGCYHHLFRRHPQKIPI
jgi:CRP-like cAMP-binding protein